MQSAIDAVNQPAAKQQRVDEAEGSQAPQEFLPKRLIRRSRTPSSSSSSPTPVRQKTPGPPAEPPAEPPQEPQPAPEPAAVSQTRMANLTPAQQPLIQAFLNAYPDLPSIDGATPLGFNAVHLAVEDH